MYDAGVFTQLACPFGATIVTGINDAGVVVGQYVSSNGSPGSFVYANGRFSQFTIAGGEGVSVYAIHNDGALTGFYTPLNSGVIPTFIATPQP